MRILLVLPTCRAIRSPVFGANKFILGERGVSFFEVFNVLPSILLVTCFILISIFNIPDNMKKWLIAQMNPVPMRSATT